MRRMTEVDAADAVLRTIRQIVRKISEHSKSLYREVGLTVPQLMCLKAIRELEKVSEEVTVVMVAKELQLSAATVSRLIDRLVRAELVVRERRAKDRRKACLSLTETGLDRVESLPVPLQERFVQRLSGLPPQERSALLQSLRRIAQLMDATELDAAPMLTPEADVKTSEPES